MPVLSVVMAARNAEKTIFKAVNSILSQSYKDFELLIADDYSTDNTISIIKSTKDERIKLVKTAKPGLVSALNHCLKQVKGKYIARMDADDFAHPTRFQLQVDLLEMDTSTGVVSGTIHHIPTHNNQEGYANHVNWINTIKTPGQHFSNRFKDAPLANPSVMFRKTIIDTYGLYKDFNGPEDYEFWLRLLHDGVRFKKVESTVLDWYDYTTRLTRNHNNYSDMAFAQIKAKYFSLWWNQSKRSKNIWIWGFGKEVFKKSKWLQKYGIEITGYIDLKSKPNSERKVITHNQISKEDSFILVYVSQTIGQQNINKWFDENNYKVVENYYYMT